MRVENLPSPGLLPQGVRLRTEAARAISHVEIVHGLVPNLVSDPVTANNPANALADFFAACAQEVRTQIATMASGGEGSATVDILSVPPSIPVGTDVAILLSGTTSAPAGSIVRFTLTENGGGATTALGPSTFVTNGAWSTELENVVVNGAPQTLTVLVYNSVETRLLGQTSRTIQGVI
jgi:hypothetical protein